MANTDLQRKVIFDRTDLIPASPDHSTTSKATWLPTPTTSVSSDYNGVGFPAVIEIKRPQEEYDITLAITKAGDQRADQR